MHRVALGPSSLLSSRPLAAAIRISSSSFMARSYSKTTEDPEIKHGKPFIPRKGNLKEQIIRSYQSNKETPENIQAYEEQATQLPAWKRLLGEKVISTFDLDMDRIRSGPIAGKLYYELCKEQGYFELVHRGTKKPIAVPGIPLSKTAQFYYNDLQLPKTFAQQFQITSLHVWLLFVRMRAMPRAIGREYQQKLVDTIFSDMEKRLSTELRILSGSIIEKYKKDFNLQLRGSVMSYDEGFYLDDATLASSIWRNLFSGREDIDETYLQQLVHFIRVQLYVLENVSDFDFSRGRFGFIDPTLKYEPLTESDLKEIREVAEQTRTDAKVISPSDKSVLSTEGW